MKRVKPDSDRIEVLTEEEKIDSSTSCEKNSAYAMTRARRTKAITTEIQRMNMASTLKNIANCDDGLALEFKMKVDQLQLEPTQKVIRFKCARGSQD
ncbi:unnamed protein product [Heligmosomoides polygyrus]|uniref:MSP domain-containing protein n=1 Tax=Heligmosomoides polygyrus TaxID=6339 RepID=A0A183GSI6_HELPZ|nr:unnamed protein product [Heligmosomoides polygyrus]